MRSTSEGGRPNADPLVAYGRHVQQTIPAGGIAPKGPILVVATPLFGGVDPTFDLER